MRKFWFATLLTCLLCCTALAGNATRGPLQTGQDTTDVPDEGMWWGTVEGVGMEFVTTPYNHYAQNPYSAQADVHYEFTPWICTNEYADWSNSVLHFNIPYPQQPLEVKVKVYCSDQLNSGHINITECQLSTTGGNIGYSHFDETVWSYGGSVLTFTWDYEELYESGIDWYKVDTANFGAKVRCMCDGHGFQSTIAVVSNIEIEITWGTP